MSLSTDIRAHLVDTAAVAAIVGARVFEGRLPQWTDALEKAYGPRYPALRFELLGGDGGVLHLGGATGVARQQIQVDSYAERRDYADQLDEAVRLALHGFRGALGGGDTFCNVCRAQGPLYLWEDAVDASDVGTHRISRDFFLWHTEPV